MIGVEQHDQIDCSRPMVHLANLGPLKRRLDRFENLYPAETVSSGVLVTDTSDNFGRSGLRFDANGKMSANRIQNRGNIDGRAFDILQPFPLHADGKGRRSAGKDFLDTLGKESEDLPGDARHGSDGFTQLFLARSQLGRLFWLERHGNFADLDAEGVFSQFRPAQHLRHAQNGVVLPQLLRQGLARGKRIGQGRSRQTTRMDDVMRLLEVGQKGPTKPRQAK